MPETDDGAESGSAWEPFRRIAVVGNTGTGKTTFARRLAASLDIPHIEIDALHWTEPDWAEPPLDEFRQRVAEATGGTVWVADGNYGKVRDLVWARAEAIVWLDYPLGITLWRLLRRTLRRLMAREVLWGTNRERVVDQFASRHSLFIWALRTHRRRRREYPALLARPEYASTRIVRVRSTRDAEAWLKRLPHRS